MISLLLSQPIYPKLRDGLGCELLSRQHGIYSPPCDPFVCMDQLLEDWRLPAPTDQWSDCRHRSDCGGVAMQEAIKVGSDIEGAVHSGLRVLNRRCFRTWELGGRVAARWVSPCPQRPIPVSETREAYGVDRWYFIGVEVCVGGGMQGNGLGRNDPGSKPRKQLRASPTSQRSDSKTIALLCLEHPLATTA